jgi:HSP20 family protein
MELARFNAYDAVNRFLTGHNQVRTWSPPVDIFETETDLVFKFDAAGVNQEDIDVQLENGTMTLKGERKFENDDKVKGYHRIERSYGAFARSFTLPDTVDPEGVRADYAHSVLTITLPKKELAKPRSIKVNVN